MGRVPKAPQNTRQRGQAEQAAKSQAGAVDRGIRDDPRFKDSLTSGTLRDDSGGDIGQSGGKLKIAPGTIGALERVARSLNQTDFQLDSNNRPVLPSDVQLRSGNFEHIPDRAVPWSGVNRPAAFPPEGHGHAAYSLKEHGHPGKANNPHGNAEHSANFALAGHNHSQSVKLMSKGRREAACALRASLRGSAERNEAPDPADLRDGLLFVMGLLFDDAEEPLDETLSRDADEQLVLHLWESSGADPGDVRAPEESAHPDLDRIADGRKPR